MLKEFQVGEKEVDAPNDRVGDVGPLLVKELFGVGAANELNERAGDDGELQV